MVEEMKNDDFMHIGVGCVSLHVNRNANIWSEAVMYLSRSIRAIEVNHSDAVPIQVIVVYIVPGFRNPVKFAGTRITVKSRKGLKRVQVEAAVPDVPFSEDNPEESKKILLNLMLNAVNEVEAYVNKNKIIKGELDGAKSTIRELWEGWDVSNFRYEIPDGLEYYDFPKVNEFTTRRFIEKLPDGGTRYYDVVLDQNGKEVI